MTQVPHPTRGFNCFLCFTSRPGCFCGRGFLLPFGLESIFTYSVFVRINQETKIRI